MGSYSQKSAKIPENEIIYNFSQVQTFPCSPLCCSTSKMCAYIFILISRVGMPENSLHNWNNCGSTNRILRIKHNQVGFAVFYQILLSPIYCCNRVICVISSGVLFKPFKRLVENGYHLSLIRVNFV